MEYKERIFIALGLSNDWIATSIFMAEVQFASDKQ